MRQPLKFLIIILLGFVIYGPWLNNGFVLDDEVQLIGNELTTSASNLGEVFLRGATTHEAGRVNSYGVYYRPMMIGTFTLLRSTFGDNPLPFHFLQLLLHIANAILVYCFFRKIFSRRSSYDSCDDTADDPSSDWMAWFAAVVFLVHPLNVEAVSYIASLQDPLFAFFGLIALNLVFQKRQLLSIFSTVVMTFCFTLALLGKESALLLIFLSSLAALFFRRDRFIKATLAGAFATALYLGLRLGTAGLMKLDHSASQMARTPYATKLWSLPAVLSSYIFKFFAPWILATLQDWVVTGPDLRSFWLPLIGVIATLCLTTWYFLRRKNKLFLFFAIWALGSLGLHSHLIVPLDGTVSERWFYLIGIGFLGMMLAVAQDHRQFLIGRGKWPTIILAVVLTCVFSVRSGVRASQWRDGFTLYSADIESQPDSSSLQNNLGVELFRRGEILAARARFEISVELNPEWNVSWSNLGATYQRTGDLQKAEECYKKSGQFGAYLLAYQNLAAVLTQQGKLGEAREFLALKALPVYPRDPMLLKIDEVLRSATDKK